MRTRSLLTAAFLGIALLAHGCAKGPAPAEPVTATAPEITPGPPPRSTPDETPAATEEPSTPLTETPAPSDTLAAPAPPPPAESAAPPPSPPSAKVAAPAPTPATVPAPAPVTAARAPTAAAVATATANVVDPGGVVEIGATKSGLTSIGSDECGNCHDVQFESWSQGPHASRKPPLDCEGCHGPGSEYSPKSVMKDPARARAAGLVTPDKAFCGRCHKKGVDDDLMKKAHANE